MQKQKTIFISVFHSFISKNILNSGVLAALKITSSIRIVLLVPEIKKDFFKNEYEDDSVSVVGVNISELTNKKTETAMHRFSRLLINTHYLAYKRREQRDSNRSIFSWVRFIVHECIVRVCADRKFFQKTFLTIDAKISTDIFTDIFHEYTPDLVFSTDVFDQGDIQLMREAKKRNIKVVGMVRSWDNCLSKGLLRVKPDLAIVNNEVLKDELISIHDFPARNIAVVGLPQFDSFFNLKPEDRKTFFEKNGLDPHKRLVMFAPAGNILSDTDPDICDILVKAREHGELPDDIQFFVRNHPHHPANLQEFEKYNNFVIQTPGQALDTSTHKGTELTTDDLYFLRNILAHTDVLLWVATSLCLDALVYDVPQVVVNFDGYANKDYYHSVRRYHDEGHMKKMFVHKPFRVASTSSDLIAYINMYLQDRTTDSPERSIVKAQQFYKLDGCAGRRIAKLIQNELV